MAKDYYKILDLNKTDSKDNIKKTYRGAAKRLHPNVKRGSFEKEAILRDSGSL